MQNIAVIFHPSKISLEKITAAFAKAGFPKLNFYPTDAATGGLAITKKAIESGANHIIVAGGDGTVRACVQAVFEEDAPVTLGLVPIGTGNILARNLKLPITHLDRCIRRAVIGDAYEIDLGVAKAINLQGDLTKLYFTGIAGIGMDARIMQRTQPELKRRVGWIAYIEGGFRSLPLKFEKFDVLVDDLTPKSLKSYSILIGNAGWLPGQISMMPDARLDDGKLDVAAIGPAEVFDRPFDHPGLRRDGAGLQLVIACGQLASLGPSRTDRPGQRKGLAPAHALSLSSMRLPLLSRPVNRQGPWG